MWIWRRPRLPIDASPGGGYNGGTMPLLSYDCDTTPVKSSVAQRGEQFDCTEASCRDNSRNATAWNRQQAIARSAGESAERYSATDFRSRGRSASL